MRGLIGSPGQGDEAVEWALRMPLTRGSKTEIRRVSDESDFAEFADNEYIQKEKGWREQGQL